MDCDEPHLAPNEKMQPIQWREQSTGALVAIGPLWPQLGLSLLSMFLQGSASSPMGSSSSPWSKRNFFFSDKSPLVVAPNLMLELYVTKDCSLHFLGLHHFCVRQAFSLGIFEGRVNQFWLDYSCVVHRRTQAPPGASSLLHLLAFIGLTQQGEGISVV